MDDAARTEAQEYSANLDYTLRELQKKVGEHERELQRVRSALFLAPDFATLTALQLRSQQPAFRASPQGQVQIVKTALKDATNADPFLPFPGSVLPALLALRRTHKTIVESREYLASREAAGVEGREKRRLETDQANLRDQTLLTDALTDRIKELRRELASAEDLEPEDGVQRRLEEIQEKKGGYDSGSKDLFRSLRSFIDDRLAAMLAAEELGGPVVGGIVDIDGEALAAGFNAQGKLKKPQDSTKDKDDGKRQRRLDEIWGNAVDEGRGEQPVDEVTAAGNEMKQLLQALIQRLEEAKGDNSRSYVDLPRESAAARFLVRSKVAQFDPRDASRLRLIDFGRELDA